MTTSSLTLRCHRRHPTKARCKALGECIPCWGAIRRFGGLLQVRNCSWQILLRATEPACPSLRPAGCTVTLRLGVGGSMEVYAQASFGSFFFFGSCWHGQRPACFSLHTEKCDRSPTHVAVLTPTTQCTVSYSDILTLGTGMQPSSNHGLPHGCEQSHVLLGIWLLLSRCRRRRGANVRQRASTK